MNTKPTKPGYQFRNRKDGSRAHYWNPRRAIKGAPAILPTRPIQDGTGEDEIARLCHAWTEELRIEMANADTPERFDGTIGGLLRIYRASPDSPYHRVKYSTRRHDYDPSIRVVVETVGERRIDHLRGSDFRRWHEKWAQQGGRRAQGAIKVLRLAFAFGITERLPGCSVCCEILSKMRFPTTASRKVALSYDHAKAIVEYALANGRESIALTQALMWDTSARRIDFVGEWEWSGDGENSVFMRNGHRWKGPSASIISPDRILRITATSKNGKATSHDLKFCELTSMVLDKIELRRVGPLIINEKTGQPYYSSEYAKDWRQIADICGVPRNVQSRDTRAGALSEVDLATNDLESVRKFATHGDQKMTLKYVRNDNLDHNRSVAVARNNLRSVEQPLTRR